MTSVTLEVTHRRFVGRSTIGLSFYWERIDRQSAFGGSQTRKRRSQGRDKECFGRENKGGLSRSVVEKYVLRLTWSLRSDALNSTFPRSATQHSFLCWKMVISHTVDTCNSLTFPRSHRENEPGANMLVENRKILTDFARLVCSMTLASQRYLTFIDQ